MALALNGPPTLIRTGHSLADQGYTGLPRPRDADFAQMAPIRGPKWTQNGLF